jgi:hypothetical protein
MSIVWWLIGALLVAGLLSFADEGGGAGDAGGEAEGDADDEGGDGGDGGDGELAPTEDEKKLLAAMRARRLPPQQVLYRAARDYQREQAEQGAKGGGAKSGAGDDGGGGGSDDKSIATLADVRLEIHETVKSLERQQSKAQANADMQKIVQAEIERHERFRGASERKRRQIEAEAYDLLGEDPRLASMTVKEFNSALGAATRKAMEAEMKDSETLRGAGQSKEELETRLKAAAGAADSAAGARRSAGPGETRSSRTVDPENLQFGPDATKWPTEAEVLAEQARAAEALQRKQRAAG